MAFDGRSECLGCFSRVEIAADFLDMFVFFDIDDVRSV